MAVPSHSLPTPSHPTPSRPTPPSDLRGWFIIDIVSVLPFWAFTLVTSDPWGTLNAGLESTGSMGRATVLIRIVKLLRMLKLCAVHAHCGEKRHFGRELATAALGPEKEAKRAATAAETSMAAAFAAEGLDPERYGLFCADAEFETDEAGDTRPVIDPETGEPAVRYGLRYAELIVFLLPVLAEALA